MDNGLDYYYYENDIFGYYSIIIYYFRSFGLIGFGIDGEFRLD